MFSKIIEILRKPYVLTSSALLTFSYIIYNAFSPSSSITERQLKEQTDSNIHYHVLPDGRIIEYFEYGSPKDTAKHSILFLHGVMSSGSLWRIHNQWAISNSIHIISPSLPGWGLSSKMWPLTNKTPTLWATSDIYSLLTTLGYDSNNNNKIHVMGASLGSIFAVHLVAYHPELIKNVMLYVAFAPADKEHDPLELSSLKFNANTHRIPLFGRLLEKFIFLPIMRFLLPEEAMRSVSWQWEGLWQCTDIIYTNWDFKIENLSKDRKVFIVSGDKDEISPPENQKILHKKIPDSQLLFYHGGHDYGIKKPEIMQQHFSKLFET